MLDYKSSELGWIGLQSSAFGQAAPSRAELDNEGVCLIACWLGRA